MLITTQALLDFVKSKAKFNIKSYTSEFRIPQGIKYNTCEVAIPGEDCFDLYQYDSIDDLERIVKSINEDLNLWDCGDDEFFDGQPDKMGIIYQIFRIFQEQGRQDLIDKYKPAPINAINEYFDARESGECDLDDWDELYEEYLDNFTSSTFPVSKDTLV